MNFLHIRYLFVLNKKYVLKSYYTQRYQFMIISEPKNSKEYKAINKAAIENHKKLKRMEPEIFQQRCRFKGLNKDLIMSGCKSLDQLIYEANLYIDRTTLSNYIKGKAIPDAEVLWKLALHANSTIDEIVIPKLGSSPVDLYKHRFGLYGFDASGMISLIKDEKGNYVHFDYSSYSKKDNIIPVKLLFDSPLLYAPKGSVLLLSDNIEDNTIKSSEEDEIYIVASYGAAPLSLISGDKPFGKVETIPVDKFFISKIQKIRNDLHVDKIKANVFSYVDEDGKLQFRYLSEINNKLKKYRILKVIREL